MTSQASLITRIAIGKSLGFAVGLTAFLMLPRLLPEASPLLHWGVFFWYITFGAIVAVFGVLTRLPWLGWPFPWWLRGAIIGGWLNFVIALLAYQYLVALFTAVFGADGLLQSPFWVAAEGALLGLIIDGLATRYGGEGRATVDD